MTLSGLGNNIIRENEIAGVSVSSPNNNIYNNTFTNSNVGILISDGAQGSIFSDNTISGNSVAGIAIDASNYVLADENTISNNVGDGIVVNGSGNTINNQIISNNSGTGIIISNGANVRYSCFQYDLREYHCGD